MRKSGLRWHLKHRTDGCANEFATDNDGKSLFLIAKDGDGWTLYQTSEAHPVWSFDSPEQARKEAEIRYANLVL